MRFRTLTVIVPVYNEADTIKSVIHSLKNVRFQAVRKEIIVVNDGSRDGTQSILNSIIKNNRSGLRIVQHAARQGKGAAIQSALRIAKGEYIVVQDADREYDPHDLIAFVSYAKRTHCPAIFGSRNSAIRNKYIYPHYFWGSRLLSWLIRAFFGYRYTDPETCYKFIRSDVFRSLTLQERGFGIEVEIAVKLAELRMPVVEIPIHYVPRRFSEGKKIRARDGFHAILYILRSVIF